jgi:hypothetical protein
MRMRLACSLLLLLRCHAPTESVSGPLSMAASTEKKILLVRFGGADVRKYPTAVGSERHPTPTGHFTVRHLVWNPRWVPPHARWARGRRPAAPGDPKNPMKGVKIFFQEPDYYIHGTSDEESIGNAVSHGCIRVAEADAVELARYLMEKTGAHHDNDWYERVQNKRRPTDVRLPSAVPMVIDK